MVDASFDKQFATTRSQDLTLETCNQNSSYCDFFNNCEYHDVLSLNNVVKYKKDELLIIHFNVRSLQKNIDNLTTFLANISEMPDIIAISESKITNGQILVNFDINGYDFIHCDSTTKAGGVGIYIKKTLPYKQKSDINIELSFVENILKLKPPQGQ